MSCTAEQIAAKKRIAQERLKSKKQSVQIASNTTQSLNSATEFKSNINFYGSSNQSTSDSLKAKSSYTNSSRVSQPYQRNMYQKTIACTCAMLSDSHFTVIPSRFHQILIDTFKTIPSSSYDPAKRVWSFSLSDYELVQERVRLIKDVSIGIIPKFVLELLDKAAMKNDNDMEAACLSAIEPILVSLLLPFQKEGVCFGISKRGRCMIADEMGLGKTYQAIAIADFYRDDWPLLVCTTAGTRDTWAAKVSELLPSFPRHLICCMTSMQDFASDAKVLIVSYNLMERCSEKFLNRKFGVIILDESHTLKNISTNSTKTALEITKHAKRVILLTGTPALSRPNELYTQLQMIAPSFFSFTEYSKRYCAGKQGQFGWDSTGQSNLPELNVVLKRKFMIRRTKQQVLMELANKSRETIMLDPALIWKNEEIKGNMVSYAKDISKLKGSAQKSVLMQYYVETGQAKARAVCAYVRDLLKKDEKFIIFAHHKFMLDAIEECVSELNVDHIRIDGSTQNDVRTVLVNHFQKQSKCRVAVLSLQACNTGITLTAAQLVLFAELTWNPSTLAQAEGRAHRLGQEGTVTCKYLIASGTADDLIWEMLKSKQDVLSKAGLFNDDLADGACLLGPAAGEKIDKYVMKTPRKSNDTSEASGSATMSDMIVETSNNDLTALLDGNDEDFVNLDYNF